MDKQRLIFTDHIKEELKGVIESFSDADRLFILTDDHTQQLCWPLVEHIDALLKAEHISIPSGEDHKTLESVSHVWNELQRMGATRHSLMINLGGGLLTDLGGFAASTFKRGLRFVNVPTTLLAMVDASVGGKTGINFGGLKNEVGTFCTANCVVVAPIFLQTLDNEDMLSGYAEMLKHSLLADTALWAETLNMQLPISASLLQRNVAVKQHIVAEDPTEQGLRKALNLGHTFGHAFEAMSFTTPHASLAHGYAVAYGLICELYLSAVKCGFPVDRMRQTVRFIHENYGHMSITCNDYPALLELMHHDKKNRGDSINATLLADIGDIRIDQTISKQDAEDALDFYREGC